MNDWVVIGHVELCFSVQEIVEEQQLAVVVPPPRDPAQDAAESYKKFSTSYTFT